MWRDWEIGKYKIVFNWWIDYGYRVLEFKEVEIVEWNWCNGEYGLEFLIFDFKIVFGNLWVREKCGF